ncbi:heterodisulfide reductase-related iron-sulfur binding cluster [Streptomyces sp. NPDC056948]|uniref:heterodisulfide reductase-related iron-sulfur binding cluster n=1 Tax=Streptomyces sp. NPDC056948 TaxID=3345975 RepID=UPI003631F133
MRLRALCPGLLTSCRPGPNGAPGRLVDRLRPAGPLRSRERATPRVLAAEGCDVVIPPGQPCCGALSMHAGSTDDVARRARGIIDVLGALDVDAIVVNVAGCGSTLKECGDLLRDDPAYAERAESFSAKVRDVHELLTSLPRWPRATPCPCAWPITTPATWRAHSG